MLGCIKLFLLAQQKGVGIPFGCVMICVVKIHRKAKVLENRAFSDRYEWL